MPGENLLAPVASATHWPRLTEGYSLRWVLGMLPAFLSAWLRSIARGLLFAWLRITFRSDKLRGYRQLFSANDLAPFEDEGKAASDAAFAFYRIAGPNPLMLQQERDLAHLRSRIPFDVARAEAWLCAHGAPLSLAREASAGRLFAVDYARVTAALERTRDSRWRDKYLAAPVAVFLEAPGFRHSHPGCSLVPIAIQIDQLQPPNPAAPGERNPVYTPDAGVGWRIAKAHFEATDANWHVMVGHTSRAHVALEAFCIATARQLERRHPVRLMLEGHLRFTLPAARAAYAFYAKRRNLLRRPTLYFRLFSGTLQHTRGLVKEDYRSRPFHAFRLEADLAARGVSEAPGIYPYRDDARLWLRPLARFTARWVEACYADELAVRGDRQLAAWAEELEDPARGAVRGLVPGGALDTRTQLAELLAHVLFIAGPFHASQHYAEAYSLRHSAIFPSGAWRPPPWEPGELDPVDWLSTLPPLREALTQFRYNSFVHYRYDRFGDYRRYALGRDERADAAIRELGAELRGLETRIAAAASGRMFRYDFLKPSLVPNSANI